MEKLLKNVTGLFNDFRIDAQQRALKGNKAAGARSRKTSLDIEKLLKEWRKLSVKEEVR